MLYHSQIIRQFGITSPELGSRSMSVYQGPDFMTGRMPESLLQDFWELKNEGINNINIISGSGRHVINDTLYLHWLLSNNLGDTIGATRPVFAFDHTFSNHQLQIAPTNNYPKVYPTLISGVLEGHTIAEILNLGINIDNLLMIAPYPAMFHTLRSLITDYPSHNANINNLIVITWASSFSLPYPYSDFGTKGMTGYDIFDEFDPTWYQTTHSLTPDQYPASDEFNRLSQSIYLARIKPKLMNL